MGSLIRATNLHGFEELVTQLGGDPAPLLARYGIRSGIDRVEDAFIGYAALAQLLDRTAYELRCPDFGLRLAAWQGIDILGPVAVIARNAETVIDGFAQIGLYLHTHSPALHLDLMQPGAPGFSTDAISFDFRIEERGLPYLPQSYELSLANGNRILRLLGGEDTRPAVVAFRHAAQGPLEAYEATFEAPVLFGQDWSGMAVAMSDATRPINAADPATLRVVSRYLEASFGHGDELHPRVSGLVRRLLPTGTCSAGSVASYLGLHPRTLQRQLAGEGTSFAEILERERRDRAVQLLGTPGIQLRQISGLLGYGEQSTFNRAFRRWFGMTPRTYRTRSR